MKLPDFVGLGALKAGTSYLDALLRTHPDLCLPAHLKEAEFFNHHYDRGLQWYSDLFPDSAGVRGEISPQYLHDPVCPARIAAALPDVRLLLSVRNPVDRVFSQYRHTVRETGYRKDFDTYLHDHPGAVARGEYFTLLSRYLAYYPLSQVHVLVFEDLVEAPLAELARVFGFLGVDEAHTPAASAEPVNAAGELRWHRAYVLSKRFSRLLYARGQGRWVQAAKRSALAGRLRQPATGQPVGSAMTPQTRQLLTERYASEVRMLGELLGRDLAARWR